MSDGPLVIIDGDVLCYQACKPRWEKKVAANQKYGFVSLDDDGKREQLEYTEAEDQAYMAESWNNFPKVLDEVLDACWATDYLMAVKGPTNYRDDLYGEYKANRRNSQPQLKAIVPRIRQLAVMSGYAIEAEFREADDYIRIWANEAKAAGRDFIIASIDKDLHCIPGKHWLIKKQIMVTISPEEAQRFYYQQLLKGDPTDNIPGLPGIGDVKALKMIEGCRTEADFQEVVVSNYIAGYGDDWENQLLANGKMIHIQNHLEDWFTIREWPLVQELRG
jgi:5'-3' exonuclease